MCGDGAVLVKYVDYLSCSSVGLAEAEQRCNIQLQTNPVDEFERQYVEFSKCSSRLARDGPCRREQVRVCAW